MRDAIFTDLFVLELASNHWGKLERGLKIVQDYGRVVRANGVRAAMKLQFRDVDSFIHKDFRARADIRYVKKTLDTHMPWESYRWLTQAVRDHDMVAMATPFDERSVEKCVEYGVEIIKIASSDIKDWHLIGKIAATKKPVIISTGGASLAEIDAIVAYFNARDIPLAINHCVSLYPSEDADLELNQIDFLINRYPDNEIGFSSHEYHDWQASLLMAYAKGARTFERHVDIDYENVPVSAYCSLPHQVDVWFKAFNKAKEMCGGSGKVKRTPPQREIAYLDALARGVYAKRDLPAGHVIGPGDVYLAIPLQQGQMSCRELAHGDVLRAPVAADGVVRFDNVDGARSGDDALRAMIATRGLPADAPQPQLKLAARG